MHPLAPASTLPFEVPSFPTLLCLPKVWLYPQAPKSESISPTFIIQASFQHVQDKTAPLLDDILHAFF